MKTKQSHSNWARGLVTLMGPRVGAGIAPALSRQPALLRQGVAVLARASTSRGAQRLALPEQPFDRHLLAVSRLYRTSRTQYLSGGGQFGAALVSSPRTLGSPILLEQRIEYSPIESELIWAATDPGQAKATAHLLQLRTFASSLFHEQSHRLLWRKLRPPAGGAAELRRYLNFVESLVITLDMALGDELGPGLAAIFYLSGVVYDPGTTVRAGLSRRDYRNYLQAALHATYLNLEQYDLSAIPEAIAALFPMLSDEMIERASARALNLDRGFVTRTNPVWQKRHGFAVRAALSRFKGKAWELPSDPMDHREQYLFAESWFENFGL